MWTLNGIRIFVDGVKPKKELISAELNPIGNTESTVHVFGAKSRKYSITGRFVGLDTEEALVNVVNSGLPVLLSGNQGFVRNVLVQNFEYDWENTIAQTFDPTHDCTDPVFKFSFEAIEQ